ncbi:ParB/RepB/Spo0J family partition protein [Pikeienuella sp. HZG-20]|uniref:ParB/RepB/Spo0J family partition protein n=1 Tax=Paludibacillus litoralis TaxID=3133267 RepID=UPI0030EEF794
METTEPPILAPLDEIDESALFRDRVAMDETALEELIRSIAASGLRAPVELFPLAAPRPPFRYGLVSGFRRLTAFRLLRERTGLARFAAIPAWVREAETDADLIARMVEENDVRRDISPWEKGRIAVEAAHQGYFSSVEEAVARLYPAAQPMKRSRIRAVARVVEALEDLLTEPWRLSERQCLRLAAVHMRENFMETIQTALEQSSARSLDAQWRLIEPILAEAELPARPGAPAPAPGRPRRVLRPKHGLTIRRERTPDGYILHFTGKLARDGLMEDVLDDIARRFAPV